MSKRKLSDADDSKNQKMKSYKTTRLTDTTLDILGKRFPEISKSLSHKGDYDTMNSGLDRDLGNLKLKDSNNYGLITADLLCKYFTTERQLVKEPKKSNWMFNTAAPFSGFAIGFATKFIFDYGVDIAFMIFMGNDYPIEYFEWLSSIRKSSLYAAVPVASGLGLTKYMYSKGQKRPIKDEKKITTFDLKCTSIYKEMINKHHNTNIKCGGARECRKMYISKYTNEEQELLNEYVNLPRSLLNGKSDDLKNDWKNMILSFDGIAEEAGLVLAIVFLKKQSDDIFKNSISKIFNDVINEVYRDDEDKYKLLVKGLFLTMIFSGNNDEFVEFIQKIVRIPQIPGNDKVRNIQERIWRTIETDPKDNKRDIELGEYFRSWEPYNVDQKDIIEMIENKEIDKTQNLLYKYLEKIPKMHNMYHDIDEILIALVKNLSFTEYTNLINEYEDIETLLRDRYPPYEFALFNIAEKLGKM